MQSRPLRAVAEKRSTTEISDSDGLSDGDSDANSDNGRYRSEDERGGPSPRKNVPWDELNE